MKNDEAALRSENLPPALAHTCPACPACKGELRRTWRRPVDRFASLFVPVHRYRCAAFSCQWEGNFKIQTVTEKPIPLSANVPVLIAVGCSASAVLAVLGVIAIGSQWPSGIFHARTKTLDDNQFASFKLIPSDPNSTQVIELQSGPRNGAGIKAK